MLRVKRPGNPPFIETISDDGALGFNLGPGGTLLVARVEKKMQRVGPGLGQVVEGIESTPLKAYGPGQWLEVEYVAEPGDGLVFNPEPAAVDSQP